MVRIRLRRMGSKHKPSYRVVVADARAPRDGKFIETIGHYNPQQQPKVVVIKQDRARYWLGVGAQPSDTVVRLLKVVGVFDTEGKLAPESAEPVAVVEEPAKRTRNRKVTADESPAQNATDESLAQSAAEETAVETAEA
jgi:small subunit ribosomal protein S16